MIKNCKETVADVTKDVVLNIKKKKVTNLTKTSDENLLRSVSADGLTGFLEFSDDLKFNLRLNKRIQTDDKSPINCIANVDNTYIAIGYQDKSVFTSLN